MRDVSDGLKAGVFLQSFRFSAVDTENPPIGLVCVRRYPPTPSFPAQPGFRVFLEVLDRICRIRFCLEHQPVSA